MDEDARKPTEPAQHAQVDDPIAAHLERVEDELLHGKRSHADPALPENQDRAEADDQEREGAPELPADELPADRRPEGDEVTAPPYPPVE
jgi:hypothetical protein